MSRSSPGVARVAAVLNFIADHPGQAFALTDLVRALKISRATCHSLLTGLVEVGYLYRRADKTYVLGPTLASIGRNAEQHFSPLKVTRPEMRELADEFDVVCGAYFLESGHLYLRERAASLSHIGYPTPVGTRIPLRWVQAITFYAGSPLDAQSWAKRVRPPLNPTQMEQFMAGIGFVDQYGFIPLIRRPGSEDSVGLEKAMEDPPVIPLTDVALDNHYPLMAIMAPIFDDRRKVSMALVMAGFHKAMTGTDILQAGARLAATCSRITAFATGHPSVQAA